MLVHSKSPSAHVNVGRCHHAAAFKSLTEDTRPPSLQRIGLALYMLWRCSNPHAVREDWVPLHHTDNIFSQSARTGNSLMSVEKAASLHDPKSRRPLEMWEVPFFCLGDQKAGLVLVAELARCTEVLTKITPPKGRTSLVGKYHAYLKKIVADVEARATRSDQHPPNNEAPYTLEGDIRCSESDVAWLEKFLHAEDNQTQSIPRTRAKRSRTQQETLEKPPLSNDKWQGISKELLVAGNDYALGAGMNVHGLVYGDLMEELGVDAEKLWPENTAQRFIAFEIDSRTRAFGQEICEEHLGLKVDVYPATGQYSSGAIEQISDRKPTGDKENNIEITRGMRHIHKTQKGTPIRFVLNTPECVKTAPINKEKSCSPRDFFLLNMNIDAELNLRDYNRWHNYADPVGIFEAGCLDENAQQHVRQRLERNVFNVNPAAVSTTSGIRTIATTYEYSGLPEDHILRNKSAKELLDEHASSFRAHEWNKKNRFLNLNNNLEKAHRPRASKPPKIKPYERPAEIESQSNKSASNIMRHVEVRFGETEKCIKDLPLRPCLLLSGFKATLFDKYRGKYDPSELWQYFGNTINLSLLREIMRPYTDALREVIRSTQLSES